MVYGTYNELVNGVYKPSYNWGAPPCINQWEIFRIQLMEVRKRNIYKAICSGDIR